MKKRSKKLHIHRETLRHLAGAEIRRVAGAARGPLVQSENCTGDCETNFANCLPDTMGIGTCLTFDNC